MTALLRRWWRHDADFWSGSTAFLSVLILIPLAVLVAGIGHAGPDWTHVAGTVLTSYVANTLLLIVAVSAIALLMALPTAWIVTVFEFPGRRIFEWALILPLAIPSYVAAFVYVELPQAAIPLLVSIRQQWGFETYAAVEVFMRYGLLSLLMASVLYPYLYISARATFSRQQRTVLEAARTLGRSPSSVLRSVALPLARPAIVSGLSLIVMEVVNDYGAVHFFGVPTLTEGIFRTWFGLGDRASAVRLAGIIMTVVLLLLFVESVHRGRARFAEDSIDSRPLARRRLGGAQAFGAVVACLVPLTLGFIFPLWQLVRWATMTGGSRIFHSWQQLGHSLLLSVAAAAILTVIGLIFAYAWRLHPVRWLRGISRLATLGYAAPGAVVALGVMVTMGWLDGRLSEGVAYFGSPAVFLSGSIITIGFAYLVRFLAVSFQPLQAGMERNCGGLDEASRVLGRTATSTFWRVNLPLLRGSMLAAFTLVFVDILKELPLTLILRPANFETLATVAFGMASEGRIQESAIPSLLIVFLGAAGLLVLNVFVSHKPQ